MRPLNLKKNEILARPQDSPIYRATIPRLALKLEHSLKAFVPKQENLEKLQLQLQSHLILAAVAVSADAYKLGSVQVESKLDPIKGLELKNAAKASAILASHQVTNATANAFGLKYSIYAGMSKKHAKSGVRADAISQHEMRNNFMKGLRYGWSLNRMSRKRSYVSSDHDKDDICDDAEDVGVIDVDDTFPSGDFEPPFHFGCLCGFILVR